MNIKQLIFATSNPNKIKEVNELLDNSFDILSLKELGCEEDIPETSPTLEGNALQKARYVNQHYKRDCFSEDTGLEIESLQGAPGVHTARYAGIEKDMEKNMSLVLTQLQGKSNRKAQFRTVIALILADKEYLFEGIVKGNIAIEKSGTKGFGYDPIFIPEGAEKCFAEMTAQEKNAISHRARAMKKLISFLKE